MRVGWEGIVAAVVVVAMSVVSFWLKRGDRQALEREQAPEEKLEGQRRPAKAVRPSK